MTKAANKFYKLILLKVSFLLIHSTNFLKLRSNTKEIGLHRIQKIHFRTIVEVLVSFLQLFISNAKCLGLNF